MFAKLLLKSFIYSLAETFCFLSPIVKSIYQKYQIEKILIYDVLTDTNSTVLQFIIISDPNSDMPETKIRDIFFEVIIATKIYKRFDTSHPFWDNFQARKESRKKNQVITKPNILTIHVMSLQQSTLKNILKFLKTIKQIKSTRE